MSTSIQMLISQQAGSLERILRVVRHRGFRIIDMNVSEAVEQHCMMMSLMVSGERHPDLLTKQLNKLFDVKSLTTGSLTHGHLTKERGVSYAKTA